MRWCREMGKGGCKCNIPSKLGASVKKREFKIKVGTHIVYRVACREKKKKTLLFSYTFQVIRVPTPSYYFIKQFYKTDKA